MQEHATTDLPKKRCPVCDEFKPLEAFRRKKTGEYGRYPLCRVCITGFRPIPVEKICKACTQIKPLEEFHRQKGAKDRRAYFCRLCANARNRIRNRKPREVLPARHKRCTKCHTVKPCEQFHRDAQHKDGFRPDCMTCNLERARYYQKHHRDIARAAYTRRRIKKQHGHVEGMVINRQAIIERDGGRCHICGRKPKLWGTSKDRREWLTLDHLVPITDPGFPTVGETPANLAVACLGCNARKNNRRDIATQLRLF